MNFDDWEPVYRAILADFGFPRAADEKARDLLAELLGDRETFDPAGLDATGATVAIAGAGPGLENEADLAAGTDLVFAASTAADRLEAVGVAVDCMVTDLDKNPGTVLDLTADGLPVAVHAHGDNQPALCEYVPQANSESLLPTTQAAPTAVVHNFGGFTDGDRAAFLADHLGAAELVFPGWDFDDPSVSQAKRRKLRWAERLLYWLERRRDEQFAVLDGRRSDLDASGVPV
jgi:hypothetical protein